MPYYKLHGYFFERTPPKLEETEGEYYAVRFSEEYSRNPFVVCCIKFSLQDNFFTKDQLFQDFNNLMNGHCDTVVLKH